MIIKVKLVHQLESLMQQIFIIPQEPEPVILIFEALLPFTWWVKKVAEWMGGKVDTRCP